MVVLERRDVTDGARGNGSIGREDILQTVQGGKGVVLEGRDVTVQRRKGLVGRDVILQLFEGEMGRSG